MKQRGVSAQSVLLVDDEQHILISARLALQSAGIEQVLTESDSRQVMELIATQAVGAVVLDLHMPHLAGTELLRRIVWEYPQIPVILVTADDDVQVVVECMKLGAFDYLVKPVETSRLVATVRKALEMRELSSEISSLKQRLLSDELEHPEAFAGMVSNNKAMRALFHYIEVVAVTRQPIMISGETGVGKEMVARAIHALSGCPGEFVSINVAGLDDNMFSDTLFGHKKGAFTGADRARDGLIAKAAGGTLLLDEIGDLSLSSQVKLLRVLQEQEYYPVGSDLVKKSTARIVLATNRDLQQLVAAGTFRNDLYYRLYAHRVHLPPLRERLDDIPMLLDHFLAQAAKQLGKKKPTPPPELARLLALYPYPGNIRELEAMVFNAVTRHAAGVLSMHSFKAAIGEQPAVAVEAAAEEGQECCLISLFGIAEVENHLIEKALKLAHGNQGQAARLLGMGRQTLNKRLNKK